MPILSAIGQFLLTQAFNLINSVIITEGPAAIAWVEAEIAAFEAKFKPKTPAPPTPPAA